MRPFSKAAPSAAADPTCTTLTSRRGSRPPRATSQRTVRSCAPPTTATPTVAPLRLATRASSGLSRAMPVRLASASDTVSTSDILDISE